MQRLMKHRHRVARSAVMNERDPDSHVYEAWYVKTGMISSVVPAELEHLADDLERHAREVDALGAVEEERDEPDSWSSVR